jgi:hypothetical protein
MPEVHCPEGKGAHPGRRMRRREEDDEADLTRCPLPPALCDVEMHAGGEEGGAPLQAARSF